MFPSIHQQAVEFCSTHTFAECFRYANLEAFKGIIAGGVILAIGLIIIYIENIRNKNVTQKNKNID